MVFFLKKSCSWFLVEVQPLLSDKQKPVELMVLHYPIRNENVYVCVYIFSGLNVSEIWSACLWRSICMQLWKVSVCMSVNPIKLYNIMCYGNCIAEPCTSLSAVACTCRHHTFSDSCCIVEFSKQIFMSLQRLERMMWFHMLPDPLPFYPSSHWWKYF